MFPVCLLLYGWWARRPLRRVVLSSLTFFAVSAIFGCVAVVLQAHRSTASDGSGLGGVLFRLSFAGQALSFYFRQALAPHNLSPVYDRWAVGGFGWWLPWLAALALCWWKRATWGRTALLGLGWFGLHLIPVLGVVGISFMRFTWVMDHFLYASLIGVVGLTAAALQLLASRAGQTGKAAAIALVAVAAIALLHESRAYTPAYASEEALWTYTVRRQPDQSMALGNLGSLRVNQGRLAEAVALLTHAVELDPAAPEAHRNLGVAYNLLGKPNDGIAEARRALALRPDYLLADTDLGTYLAQTGRYADAVPYWEAALRLHPNDADIHNRYGYTLLLMDRRQEGLAQIQRALALDPHWGPAEFNLGLALAAAGQNTAALPHFEAAARLMPDNAAVQQQVILARKRQ